MKRTAETMGRANNLNIILLEKVISKTVCSAPVSGSFLCDVLFSLKAIEDYVAQKGAVKEIVKHTVKGEVPL